MMPAERLMKRCGWVIESNGPQEKIDDLMVEAEGYLHAMRLTHSEGILQDRTIDGVKKLKGWLGFHAENLAYSASNTTVNASASATAVVDIDISQVMSQMWSLPDAVLDLDGKTELAGLLSELEESKKDGPSKVKEAAKAVGEWLFDKGLEAVPTVMPFIMQAIRSASGL